MELRWSLRPLLVGALFTVVNLDGQMPAKPDTVVSIRQHEPIIIHEREERLVSSTSESGYAVTGANGSVTRVTGPGLFPL